MGFKVVWTPLARGDLHEIVSYIARDNPAAALRVGDQILGSVEALGNQPVMRSGISQLSKLMKSTRPAIYLLLFLILSVFGCGRGVSVSSTKDVDPERFAYNVKTTVDAYEKVGRNNWKWNGDARTCLTAFARMRSVTNHSFGESQDVLRRILPRIVEDKKCDDPLVRYLWARFVFGNSHPAAENTEVYNSVAAALQQSRYPDLRKFYAAAWAYRIQWQADRKSPQLAPALDTANSDLASALEDPSLPAQEANEACEFLFSSGWWAEGASWNSYQVLEPVLTNRWKDTSVAYLAKGRAYLSYAWVARGTGYANTVSEQGWQSMGQRLKIAADALETAWKLNPRDPRICQAMMGVKLGQGSRDEFETWFQRGMQIDPANHDLCAEKLEFLRPRWYGSIKEMIDFGRQCTMNTNWSGSVRLMLVDAHEEASREIQDEAKRAAYFRNPQVWSDIRFAYEQFFTLYPQESGVREKYITVAGWCGQWQEVLNQFKLLPYTNYAFFGGFERFNGMLQYAEQQSQSQH